MPSCFLIFWDKFSICSSCWPVGRAGLKFSLFPICLSSAKIPDIYLCLSDVTAFLTFGLVESSDWLSLTVLRSGFTSVHPRNSTLGSHLLQPGQHSFSSFLLLIVAALIGKSGTLWFWSHFFLSIFTYICQFYVFWQKCSSWVLIIDVSYMPGVCDIRTQTLYCWDELCPHQQGLLFLKICGYDIKRWSEKGTSWELETELTTFLSCAISHSCLKRTAGL